jgi:hypothetical protein
VNTYLAGLAGFGQGDVRVKVEHRDSIESCLELVTSSLGWLRLFFGEGLEYRVRGGALKVLKITTGELFAKLK